MRVRGSKREPSVAPPEKRKLFLQPVSRADLRLQAYTSCQRSIESSAESDPLWKFEVVLQRDYISTRKCVGSGNRENGTFSAARSSIISAFIRSSLSLARSSAACDDDGASVTAAAG